MSDDETKSPTKLVAEDEPPQTSGKHDRSDGSDNEAGDEDGWIGPLPTEAVPTKKRKGTWALINRKTFKILRFVHHHPHITSDPNLQ